jgi:hypothetical protein
MYLAKIPGSFSCPSSSAFGGSARDAAVGIETIKRATNENRPRDKALGSRIENPFGKRRREGGQEGTALC